MALARDRPARTPSPAPAHPRLLVGSAWTRLPSDWTYHHWTVVARLDDDVIARAVLDPTCERRLPWRALRDRACWLPGWQTCPPATAP